MRKTHVWTTRSNLEHPFRILFSPIELFKCLKRSSTIVEGLDVQDIVTVTEALTHGAFACVQRFVEDGSIGLCRLQEVLAQASFAFQALCAWAALHGLVQPVSVRI
jgi:hypothetical protein